MISNMEYLNFVFLVDDIHCPVQINLSLVARKSVLQISNQVKHT